MTRIRLVISSLFALAAAAACTDHQIVYRTRAPFNPGRDTITGFLGYFSAADKQTNCGNCHAGMQVAWAGTRHSNAWADLQASGHAAASCNGCHTTNQMGNWVHDDTAAGYLKFADSSYHDVQCESCHGPGFEHAVAPNISNVPLAHIRIPTTDSATMVTSGTCAACHSGSHNPFAEEWAQSPHAGTVSEVIEEYAADPVGEATCATCHEGRATLAAWKVNTNYAEKNDKIDTTAAGLANAMPVTCVVCHDPHAKNQEAQLRFAIDNPDPTQNLCTKCHNRRAEPSASSARASHAPQGAVLFGFAGWWPNGKDTILATHGNADVNTRLCAGCHVTQMTASGYYSQGHFFRATSCLDAQGRPTGDNSCARPGDAGYVSGSRAFTGCAKGGCHNSAVQAENAFAASRAALEVLAGALWTPNGNENMYDTSSTGYWSNFTAGSTGLLTQLADTDAYKAYNYKDKVISVAEGVYFNVRLLGEDRYPNGDGSMGTHNPLLAQTLLAQSITALKAKYPYLSVPAPVQQLVSSIQVKAAAYRAAASAR